VNKTFYSHNEPTIVLKDHLEQVARLSWQMLDAVPVDNADREALSLMSRFIGIGHDYGKFTSYFQDYLIYQKRTGRLHEHSFISALFTAYLIWNWLKYRVNGGPIYPKWLTYGPLIGYFTVLHHHGHLKALKQDVINLFDYEDEAFTNDLKKRIEIMKQQLTDQSQWVAQIEAEYTALFETLNVSPFWGRSTIASGFIENWERMFSVLDKLFYDQYYYETDETLQQRVYLYTLLLYSALIDADKHAAAGLTPSKRLSLPDDLVDQYRQNHFDVHVNEGINGWRNRIYDTVMKRLDQLGERLMDQNLFTLTAPTGAGKTLLSFSVALKLRNKIKEKLGYTPRIIYSLPYTSIIDQNEQVLEKVLNQIPDFALYKHNYLLKHHHLTDIRYTRDGEEQPLKHALLLMESWETEVVVTTFIQLFHSIVGYQNRWLKKFHQLAGAIVILDEVQNLPIEYWPLMRKALNSLSEILHCKFVLLTATQPFIFEPGEALELLQAEDRKHTDFFAELNRVVLQLDQQNEKGYSLEEWIDLFKHRFENGLSYLAIFNTIGTSVTVYKAIKEWIENTFPHYKVYYLSTNIVPRERRRRIRRIKYDLNKNFPVILISTQVVEAGVDLDFDVVFRDLGPIDAIIQAAGRCNRNGKRYDLAKVWITPILRGEQLESTLVYRKLHTFVSKRVLPQEAVVESQFHQLVEKYFGELKTRKDMGNSAAIWEAMNALRFDHYEGSEGSAVSDFKLIKDEGYYIDVFVEADHHAVKIWEIYKTTVLCEEDTERRYHSYLRLKRLLRQYTVSAPFHLMKGLWNEEDYLKNKSLLYLPSHLLNQYYNLETGVLRSAQEADTWVM
jgi:CRISPR-associated endonuclease/helicase Cas3